MLETRPAPAPATMDGLRCLREGGGESWEADPNSEEEGEEAGWEAWAGLADEARGWVLRYLGVPDKDGEGGWAIAQRETVGGRTDSALLRPAVLSAAAEAGLESKRTGVDRIRRGRRQRARWDPVRAATPVF